MHRFARAAALGAAPSLVLAGCAAFADAEEVPVASPTVDVSATPTVDVSVAPTAESTPAIGFPAACADLISAAELGAIVDLTVYEVPWADSV